MYVLIQQTFWLQNEEGKVVIKENKENEYINGTDPRVMLQRIFTVVVSTDRTWTGTPFWSQEVVLDTEIPKYSREMVVS